MRLLSSSDSDGPGPLVTVASDNLADMLPAVDIAVLTAELVALTDAAMAEIDALRLTDDEMLAALRHDP